MSQLRQVFLVHAFHHLALVLQAFFPDRLDPNSAGVGQVCAHGTPVAWVWHPLDETVSLEVVDQAGDVAGRRVEVIGQVAERAGALPVEAEEHAKSTFAQAVRLGPSLLEMVERAAGDPKGGHSLDNAHVDFQRLKQLAHTDAVQPSVLVAGELMPDLGIGYLGEFRWLHSEQLHYYHIQGSGVKYSPRSDRRRPPGYRLERDLGRARLSRAASARLPAQPLTPHPRRCRPGVRDSVHSPGPRGAVYRVANTRPTPAVMR